MKSEKRPLLTLQKDIKKLLVKGVSGGFFPCAAVGVSRGLGKEKKIVFSHYGNAISSAVKKPLQKQHFFDLASLTKPLATTMATLCLINEKKIAVDEELSSLVEKKISGPQNNITAGHLLSHSSGLPAHREYFKDLKDIAPEEINKFVEKLILQEQLEYEPGAESLYSDLGFILLGRIIEKKAGCSLEHYVEEKVLQPLKLQKKIFFAPLSGMKKSHKQSEYVATENCPWRKKVLQGEVHDDNCYTMGGVAGHSGLFGNIEGVTLYAGLILDMWKGVFRHPHINREDLVYFLTRQEKIPGSSWALGFDTPAEKESSCGRYFSQKSVGHLGFTGTSFWIDPEKDVVMVLLSNRVHPSRENIRIKKYRPYFHDSVMKKMFPGRK
ncbi:MAG: serine hydrolase [Desulfobulbales bacterium]|nr:serine hydrolase [Desulfobulbales bacterium]